MSEAYPLRVGAVGCDRLRILGTLYDEATRRFLVGAGVSQASSALEVGCGRGDMARWLQGAIRSDGLVTAIDESEAQVAEAIACSEAAGGDDVCFRVCSTRQLHEWTVSFDFVYCRWVLLHLSDPLDAVRGMVNVLRPGGTIVLEDCVTSTAFSVPRPEAFDRYIEGWLAVSAMRGVDPCVGDRLVELSRGAGLHVVGFGTHQPLLRTTQERLLPALSLDESREAHVESGFMSEAELARCVGELRELAASDATMGFVRNVRVAATRRA